ncbi:MAG: hypothetical protein ACU84Q_08735 [Gammaproteobacteria bacterium]
MTETLPRFFLVGLVVIASLVLVIQRSHFYQAPVFEQLDDFQPPRLWGRKSFIPNWRAADEIDERAARHFLDKWLPNLNALPNVEAAYPTPDDLRVSVFHVPHWVSISPFAETDKIAAHGTNGKKFAARGESEPFAFAIRNDGDPTKITVNIQDWRLNGEQTSALPASFRLMLPYQARAKAGKKTTKLQVKPMLLLANPAHTWSFPEAYAMVVVADIHVDEKSTPGTYTANFTVASGNAVLAQIPLLIEVLPFELRVNNFHAGAFGTTYDIWEGGFSGYYPEMIEMDSRYGFNIAGGFFNKGNELTFSRDPQDRLIVDRATEKFKKFDNTMSLLREHGMGDVLFWNWGGSGKYEQFLKVMKAAGIRGSFGSIEGKREFASMLRAIKDVEKSRGWPEIVINPFDEALKEQKATREVIAAVPFVHQQSPGTRLYMTEWRSGYARHYQSSGEQLTGEGRPREPEYRRLLWSGESPRLNFDVIGSNILDPKARALQDKLGGEYWNYTGAWSLSATTQFGLGFRAWITRSETVLIWANYKGSLKNQGWTVHHPLPLDKNGRKNRNTRGPVLAGAQAYVVREGIDDRKYIETLRYHAWRTGSAEDWRYLNALAKRARIMLKNAQDIGGLHNIPGRLVENVDLLKVRTELKERIVKLIDLPSIH